MATPQSPRVSEVTLVRSILQVQAMMESRLAALAVEPDVYYHYRCKDMVASLTAAVWGRRIDQKIIKYPANWVEAVKDRWFPKWAKDRWPVVYERHSWEAYHDYPSLAIQKHQPVLRIATHQMHEDEL